MYVLILSALLALLSGGVTPPTAATVTHSHASATATVAPADATPTPAPDDQPPAHP